MAILGIDLGTSNSAAAVALGNDVRMIEPTEGPTDEGTVFPSYVAFDANGLFTCAGVAAKRQFHNTADLVVRHAKRLIGRSYDYLHREIEIAKERGQRRRFLDEFEDRIERGDTGEVMVRVGKRRIRAYSPQEIARFLLEKIRQDAEPQVRSMLGAGIEGAVVTVPAGFDDAPLRATMWAGEQVFGEGKVQLVPEPLAAAIASDVRRDQETIMVVDMGAGTTDIVVGNVVRNASTFRWVPIMQSCDDELGGWDMDGLILEHLLRSDQKEPYLRQVYPHLDLRNQGRLMEAIERAKIAVSTAGSGQVGVVLEAEVDGRAVRKALTHLLDQNTLRSVVAYRGKKYNTDKGSVVERCRKLVEDTLFQLADNDLDALPEVKRSLSRVILVGGPMRMRAMYDLMSEVFADRPEVLESYDPLNPFPMECVAQGAALYRGGKVTLQVPHALSIFDWGRRGHVNVIPRGIPYEGEAMGKVAIEVEEGATWIDIITEKENLSLGNYPVREHVVRAPQRGLLEVTLRWDTTGCRVTFDGAGVSPTEIPPISDQTTLAEDFERQFRSMLTRIAGLRSALGDREMRHRVLQTVVADVKKKAPPDLQMLLSFDEVISLDQLKVRGQSFKQRLQDEVDRMLAVSEEDLERCDNLDPVYLSKLQESELQIFLEKGYYEGARDRARSRGVTDRAFNVAWLIRRVSKKRVSVDELLKTTRTLLDIAKRADSDVPFLDELKLLFEALQQEQENRVLIANVSVRVAALADVLNDKGLISREAMRQAKSVAANAEA